MRVIEFDNDRKAFCAQPIVFPLAHTLVFTFCSINERERAGSIFMTTEAWTLFSISLPRSGEGDPAQLETHEKIVQSPSCSLKDD